ncbi:hypothetical protein EW145_g6496 [Phellinidium pouzarii]|uniref:Uncharacterized protein n=1 Tax=Phellinidium pouzarii TaxID=167371 RepID=A0A4S4KXL3_9AGAM|nr:hypothetical protein EW145_g6496 [Phellinidium pouzarii]
MWQSLRRFFAPAHVVDTTSDRPKDNENVDLHDVNSTSPSAPASTPVASTSVITIGHHHIFRRPDAPALASSSQRLRGKVKGERPPEATACSYNRDPQPSNTISFAELVAAAVNGSLPLPPPTTIGAPISAASSHTRSNVRYYPEANIRIFERESSWEPEPPSAFPEPIADPATLSTMGNLAEDSEHIPSSKPTRINPKVETEDENSRKLSPRMHCSGQHGSALSNAPGQPNTVMLSPGPEQVKRPRADDSDDEPQSPTPKRRKTKATNKTPKALTTVKFERDLTSEPQPQSVKRLRKDDSDSKPQSPQPKMRKAKAAKTPKAHTTVKVEPHLFKLCEDEPQSPTLKRRKTRAITKTAKMHTTVKVEHDFVSEPQFLNNSDSQPQPPTSKRRRVKAEVAVEEVGKVSTVVKVDPDLVSGSELPLSPQVNSPPTLAACVQHPQLEALKPTDRNRGMKEDAKIKVSPSSQHLDMWKQDEQEATVPTYTYAAVPITTPTDFPRRMRSHKSGK